jgi:hypothetical protein
LKFERVLKQADLVKFASQNHWILKSLTIAIKFKSNLNINSIPVEVPVEEEMLLNEAQRQNKFRYNCANKGTSAFYSSGFCVFYCSHHAFVVTKGFDFVKIMF